MTAPYLVKPFTPAEDRYLASRKYGGGRSKVIAYEMGRTEFSVNARWRHLKRKLERKHPDVIAMHREEELALMERIIAEAAR